MTACGTYTIDEAAQVLGVSRSTVKRRIRAGELPTIPLGGRVVRLPIVAVDRLAAGESGANLEAVAR